MSRTIQPTLFDAPRPVEPADPNVHPAARTRLGRQSLAILKLLRAAPRDSLELSDITHRFGGRLYDLRRAGCVIEKTHQDHRTGLVIYTLRHEPEGLE